MADLKEVPTGEKRSLAVTPTIVVIDTFEHLRPTSVRVAHALARPQSAYVFLGHWHRLDFSRDGVRLRGVVRNGVKRAAIEVRTISAAQQVHALFFYGPDSGELTMRDNAALAGLAAAGIDIDGVPIHLVVDRMMVEASRRGIVTNALGVELYLGTEAPSGVETTPVRDCHAPSDRPAQNVYRPVRTRCVRCSIVLLAAVRHVW